MKTFTPEELQTVLAQHKLWLASSHVQGARADLSRADLRGADLSRADLRGANLYAANLSGANLSRADLRGADLRDANLYGANLYGANLYAANLSRADLRDADLSRADLRDADLSRADLSRADLSRADLRRADLRGADLYGANLYAANLSGANLSGADLPAFALCPQEGEFVAFKKLAGGVIAKLKVPADAKRTSSLVGRKCRAEYVEVLELSGDGWDGGPVASTHDGRTLYAVGETVRPDSFDSDIRIECTHGIHFFISKAEAEAEAY